MTNNDKQSRVGNALERLRNPKKSRRGAAFAAPLSVTPRGLLGSRLLPYGGARYELFIFQITKGSRNYSTILAPQVQIFGIESLLKQSKQFGHSNELGSIRYKTTSVMVPGSSSGIPSIQMPRSISSKLRRDRFLFFSVLLYSLPSY